MPMLRFAFHTPLKPLHHPTPSGDRAMARALVALLERLGHTVQAVDRHDADAARVAMTAESLPAVQAAGRARAAALIERWSRLAPDDPDRPTGWFTYHVWYKRPDWLGPEVARALGIPYIIAEASYAPKRAGGPWDLGHRATAAAVRAADLVLTLNPDDAACLAPLLASPQAMTIVPPFLDAEPWHRAATDRAAPRASLRQRFGWPAQTPVLLAVAMMRPPDKVASYGVLAAAMRRLMDCDWRLLLVGDGAARAAVAALFAPLGPRVAFAGAQAADALPALYAGADLYVWPAMNEAYGISLLEAQAAGLPVIAGRTRGVPAVVADGDTGLLTALGEADAFADGVRRLLDDPAQRAMMGAAAMARIARDHDLAAAARTIGGAIDAMQARRAAGSTNA
ncbi:glycosyltransferase family 4 protein [Reyranella sp. CPCC 100927]|uniref:glycosyltransferase family 4 protein n=1 Tax=Reyranella sp. CPCC 100927 TaxID=2599616 RepID=UPI0011B38B8C|nr:glycosyltransferase family 4 protein [Reyranella sp. CPCC 100927]TWS99623.1 glycosyltransferase family 4 protein [Reyranella sp. CPCC 100927]